jgi:solute carrier family 25 (mitochondrial folate transporter), member 32
MPGVVAASTAPASTSPPASSSQHHHAQGLLCHAVAGASAGNVAFEFLSFWPSGLTLGLWRCM